MFLKIKIINFVIGVALAVLGTEVRANDLSKYVDTCLDLGFKKKTEALGDCVLELATRSKKAELEAQKEYDETRERKRQQEAETRKNRREEELRREEQAQMYELQRRSVAAQEEAVKAQNDANNYMILQQTLQNIQNMNRPAPTPPAPSLPITCRTFGNTTTCQ